MRVISSTLAQECKVDSLNALSLDTESGDERRDGWRRPFTSSPQSELETVVREESDRARTASKQCLGYALSTGVWTYASLQFDTKLLSPSLDVKNMHDCLQKIAFYSQKSTSAVFVSRCIVVQLAEQDMLR